MKYGLSEAVIKKITEVFSLFPQIEQVVLYGSRAKGNFKNGSDIDLTIKGSSVDLSLMNKLSLQLDELYLPYTFDLSIYNHINNSDLIEHIERVGVLFYASRPAL